MLEYTEAIKENKRKNWFEALHSELLRNKSSDTVDKLDNLFKDTCMIILVYM